MALSFGDVSSEMCLLFCRYWYFLTFLRDFSFCNIGQKVQKVLNLLQCCQWDDVPSYWEFCGSNARGILGQKSMNYLVCHFITLWLTVVYGSQENSWNCRGKMWDWTFWGDF